MKKLLTVLCALLLICSAALGEGNLLENADFSVLDGSGLPEGWSTDCWNSANTQFSVQDGTVMVYNFESNDARWTQTVKVSPRTEYLLSCYVKVEGCDEWGRGANISVLNSSAYSDSVYDTEGEWVKLELYGVTGSGQDEITVCLRVGGYSGDCAGCAWFRDVSLTQTETPSQYSPQSFATYEPASASSSDTSSANAGLPDRNTETWVLIAFIALMFYLAGGAAVKRLGVKPAEFAEKKSFRLITLALMLLVAFVARLYTASKTHGYAVDINCFMCWSERVVSNGFGLYADGYFCDYPPLYMLLLGVIGIIRRLLGVTYGSQAHIILIKLIPMLADLCGAGLIYHIYRKKAGHVRALLLAAAIAFSPAFFADSAAWGQVDSLLAFGLALSVYFAMDSKWHIALPVYALTLLTKPQALLFGPIGLLACIVDVLRNKKYIKSALIGMLASVALIYAISAPFAINQVTSEGTTGVGALIAAPVNWILDKLLGATTTYQYITVNACNLYTLLNLNWGELSGFAETFAWAMFGFAYVYSAGLFLVKRDVKALPLTGALLIAILFNFAPMMHERYLFPVLILVLMAYTVYRDKRLLWYLSLATVTQFLNIILPLEWGMTVGYESFGHLQSSEQTLNAVVSGLNVAGALLLMYTAFDIQVLGHVFELKPEGAGIIRLKQRAEEKRDYHLHLKKFDALAMVGVTLVYGVFAYWNLGTASSPESYLKTTDYKETIVFDLGEVRTYRLTYFGGIADCAFTVALSNDGVTWTEENYAEYAAGDMYRWMWYVPKSYTDGSFSNAVYDRSRVVDTGEGGATVTYATSNLTNPLQTSRYVRFTVMGVGLVLNEVAFIDVDNECLFPVSCVTGSAQNNYAALIDEQDTVSLVPSYLNGMYFDEIYHARTAYELLHGYNANSILEWSHPHLGKLLIAVGIDIFGMNPFGWRCMGTLFGIMMLPLMYLLVKQLTGKSKLALVGMLLLTFDSMHYTQSRIATVDVFAVFFIMLMYLFMIRYYMMNLHKEKLSKTFIPLGLSGLSMALGIATKWICIYAAAGLALMFFISIFKRFNEYLYLRHAEPDGVIAREFPKKLVLTALFCVLMFIVVPLLVYYFSYYWHFRTSGGLSIKKVWDLQVQMFNYHSGLTYDTHYFRSPWYEWPLIVKPMWYYSADLAYTGYGVVSSISCMGNPAVWWTGAVCFVLMVILLSVRKKPGTALLLTAIGFASQFLPWVLVPRSTFIYHYFASVPFIIIATVLMIDELGKKDATVAKWASVLLVTAAAVLFAMFYPIESGWPCAYEYALHLRWFKWYNFALQ